MYSVFQDFGHYSDFPLLHEATSTIEGLIGLVEEGYESTFTVEDANGRVLASITNRRIIGRITKQSWGGRKGDDAIFVAEEDFDATDAILLMDYDDLIKIEDNDESSDSIGTDHVSWSGPHEVRITDSICAFFGVNEIDEITRENFEYVRAERNPQASTEVVMNVTSEIRLRVAPGVSVESIAANLEIVITSQTPGIFIAGSKLIDHKFVEPDPTPAQG